MFLVDIAKFLRISFLRNTPGGCFWQSYHGTLKSAGVPVLWFPLPRAFTFDQKLSRNVAQIILCYHVTKQFLPCLNWLVTCFQFQNMFWKNINCFRFWWKTCTKRCTSNYVISRVKRFSSPALCGWSDALNFRVWSEKRNMAVKIPILILFLCLLCWLKNHLLWVLSVVAASCFTYIGPCRWF